jgi:hypothetical protein
MKYPITEQLKAAINKLFKTPATALGFLGALEEMSARAGFQESISPNVNPIERVSMLRRKLEGHVVQMATESEELADDAETLRLRTESMGILIALRELWLHFPEVFEPPPHK